jgi:hypothetical protein
MKEKRNVAPEFRNIDPLHDMSREERKSQASKPLYLFRYE